MKFALVCLSIAAAALPMPNATAAGKFPVRPVRIIVPYAPSGGSDITARAIGARLGDYLGQTFVVDNRPGASGVIGTVMASRAPADGYTMLLADGSHSINPLVYSKPPYDSIKDFTPLNLIATAPQAIYANPSFSANTLSELLAMPRTQTEKFGVGTAGLASGPYMFYERIRLATGLTLNNVPYKGGGPAINDAVAGQIPLVVNSIPAAMPFIKANRLKVLAIASAKRHPLLPNVPTFIESGVKEFVSVQWYGMLGPAGMPKDVVAILNREINKALVSPELTVRFTALIFDATPGTPADFRELLVTEDKRWRDVQKQVSVRLD